MITVNGKKVNRNDNITKNFKYREFQSKDGNKVVKLDMDMVRKLQELREWLEAPIIINSAYRSPEHNKKVGGATGSQHLKGTAVDIRVPGYTPIEIAKYGESLGFDGIGIYNTFTHLDTRGYKARWGSGFNEFSKIKLKKKPVKDHWADKHFKSLKEKGYIFSEKRFNDSLTRGEAFAMIDKITSKESL